MTKGEELATAFRNAFQPVIEPDRCEVLEAMRTGVERVAAQPDARPTPPARLS